MKIQEAYAEWERAKEHALHQEDYPLESYLRDLKAMRDRMREEYPPLESGDEGLDAHYAKIEELETKLRMRRAASEAEVWARINRATADYEAALDRNLYQATTHTVKSRQVRS